MVWPALLGTAVAVTLLQDRQRMYFLLKLICSLLTSIELRGGRKKLALGLWVLLGNTFAVYFQANIISSLQALPMDRMRSILRCEIFMHEVGIERRGMMGALLRNRFIGLDLIRFVRGGIVCQEESYMSAVKETFLRNITTYEVALHEPQYRFFELRPQYFKAIDRTLPPGRQNIAEYYLRGARCCFRLPQLLRAHSLVRIPSNYNKKTFERSMSNFMAKRLSPDREDYCRRNKMLAMADPGHLSPLCPDESDLRDGARFASSEDLWLQVSVLAIGWGISFVCAIVEWLLPRVLRLVSSLQRRGERRVARGTNLDRRHIFRSPRCKTEVLRRYSI